MKDKLAIALFAAIIGFSLWVAVPLLYSYWRYAPQEGDIIFQSLPKYSDLVTAIEGVTHSPLSHCGIVIKKADGWYVREAIVDVHDTKLFAWIKRGRDYKFEVFRLKDNYRKYIPKFITDSSKYLGRAYDVHYSFDDEYIYCSELVFKAFKDASGIQLGQVVTLGRLDWKPYEQIIRQIEGGPPPLDRPMIPPVNITKAPELKEIYNNGI